MAAHIYHLQADIQLDPMHAIESLLRVHMISLRLWRVSVISMCWGWLCVCCRVCLCIVGLGRVRLGVMMLRRVVLAVVGLVRVRLAVIGLTRIRLAVVGLSGVWLAVIGLRLRVGLAVVGLGWIWREVACG